MNQTIGVLGSHQEKRMKGTGCCKHASFSLANYYCLLRYLILLKACLNFLAFKGSLHICSYTSSIHIWYSTSLSILYFRIKPRLGNPAFKPGKKHILAALENFIDLLKIRYSSPLFRLRTANAIQVW